MLLLIQIYHSFGIYQNNGSFGMISNTLVAKYPLYQCENAFGKVDLNNECKYRTDISLPIVSFE